MEGGSLRTAGEPSDVVTKARYRRVAMSTEIILSLMGGLVNKNFTVIQLAQLL